ncbi:hypothetical protein KC326_g199 [Hortaea werneckii]|nr:hypothetical protein KC326_g199 [Hortaea werneckii]
MPGIDVDGGAKVMDAQGRSEVPGAVTPDRSCCVGVFRAPLGLRTEAAVEVSPADEIRERLHPKQAAVGLFSRIAVSSRACSCQSPASLLGPTLPFRYALTRQRTDRVITRARNFDRVSRRPLPRANSLFQPFTLFIIT